jgi:signal transduction histidine kinase
VSRTSILKSSAIRITLINVSLFTFSILIILGFIYWSTVVYTNQKTDEEINAEILSLSTVYSRRGYTGLLSELSERVRDQRQGDSTIYLLTDYRFRPLVGNIDRWPSIAFNREGGWLDFRLDDNQDNTDREFAARARTFEVENRFNLLVGKRLKEIELISRLVGRATFWGLLMAAGLAIVGGAMMRQILRSRLSAINDTSRKIMLGELRERIATRETGDEFDELADNLNMMLDQIERGMEGVRRVSDNIAHDLKTPLARLRNKVEELRLETPDNPRLDEIIGEADGLLDTFNALLRIARIEYSEKRRDFDDVDLNAILTDLQELYEPVAEENGLTMTTELGESVSLYADRNMLFQAFANLFDNAIKYSCDTQLTDGGRKGCVTLASRKTKNGFEVIISDNGPGIPEDEYDKVTQRFYRLDQSRNSPGSGLGLALTSAVLRLHKLELRFSDNEPGLKVTISPELD